MKPKNGLTTTARIVKWRDADTPIVEIKRQFAVRLTDVEKLPKYFNAPEKGTPEGENAIAFIEDYVDNEEITLFIPSNNPLNLTDIASFDRIVGEIWVGDKKLTDVLMEAGYGEFKKYK